MSLKIVYGPPPADRERIEAAELEEESCIRETETEKKQPVFPGNTLLQEKNGMAVEAGCLSGKDYCDAHEELMALCGKKRTLKTLLNGYSGRTADGIRKIACRLARYLFLYRYFLPV